MSVPANTDRYASSVGFSIAQVTGNAVVSASGLKDVSRAQASGTSHSSANATTTPVQTRSKSAEGRPYAPRRSPTAARCSKRGRLLDMSDLLLGAPDEREPDGGDPDDDQEQDHRRGRCEADPVVGEAVVVDVLQHGSRAEVR